MSDIINMNYLSGNLIDDFINSGIKNTNQFVEQAKNQFDYNIKRNQEVLAEANETIANVGQIPFQLNAMANAEIIRMRKNENVLIHNLQVTNKIVTDNANAFVKRNSDLVIGGANAWFDDQTDNISETFGNQLKQVTTPINKVLEIGEDLNKNWDSSVGQIDKAQDTLKETTKSVETMVKYTAVAGAVLGTIILLKK